MTSERERRELDAAIRRVVQRNACIGCGLCTRLDTSLRMELEPDGFLRPHRTGVDGVVADDAARRFEQACPGCRVAAVRPRGSRRHPTMGSYFGVWEAWASDDAVRWRGSSGGALTALHAWLARQRAIEQDRLRGDGPGAPAHRPGHDHDEGGGARGGRLAVRPGGRARRARPHVVRGDHRQAVRDLGDPRARDIRSLRRRPNRHRRRHGIRTSRSSCRSSAPAPRRSTPPASSSRVSGSSRTTPSTTSGTAAEDGRAGSRCAVPTATHRWATRSHGAACSGRRRTGAARCAPTAWASPPTSWRRTSGGWTSAGTRCSPRDPDRAPSSPAPNAAWTSCSPPQAAGALVLRPIRMSELANVQPLQRNRRTSLFGRLLGSRLAGVPGPRYRGFRLWALALAHPRRNLRAARGTRDRLRRSTSATGPSP